MILDIKQNINKIDFDLKKLFENVYIAEKADKGNFYFSITANKMFLFEGCKKRIEVKVDINKNDLNSTIVKWNYSLNPLNESAEKIERVSYIQNIANEIFDVASNRRMIKEYFDALEAHVDLINENTTGNLNEDLILSSIKKYIQPKNIDRTKDLIKLTVESLKMSDKFNLEKDLLATEKVEYVSFDDNSVKIKLK